MVSKLARAVIVISMLLGFCWVPAVVAAAGDFYVPTIDYPTIQSGIDAAVLASGGTVHVGPGTYVEKISWPVE